MARIIALQQSRRFLPSAEAPECLESEREHGLCTLRSISVPPAVRPEARHGEAHESYKRIFIAHLNSPRPEAVLLHAVVRPQATRPFALWDRFLVKSFPHHLQRKTDVADLAVIVGVVLLSKHPVGNRPCRG